jgi:hypothetical protein
MKSTQNDSCAAAARSQAHMGMRSVFVALIAGAPATAPATGPAVDSIVLLYGPPEGQQRKCNRVELIDCGCFRVFVHSSLSSVPLLDESDEYDKATAVQMYLFGWEFPDTALAFCREPDTLLVLTSAKKCRMLEAISKDERQPIIKLQLHIANKADKNAANIQTIIKALKQSKSGVSTPAQLSSMLGVC